MRRVMVTAAILSLLALAAAWPTLNAAAVNTAQQVPGSIPLDQIVLGGVTLGLAPSEVIGILGTPDSVRTLYDGEMISDTVRILSHPGLTTTIYGRFGVQFVTCTSGTCITARGIGIGASRQRVEEMYGPGIPTELPTRPSLLYRAEERLCGLTFAVPQDTVRTIHLWCDWS